MKREMKLWLRKRALMMLRAVIWHADEWLHHQEIQLREDLSARKPCRESSAHDSAKAGTSGHASPTPSARAESETFLQWEARRSGIAVISKKEARRRRERVTASAFDLRFAR